MNLLKIIHTCWDYPQVVQKMGLEEYYVNRIILALTEDFASSLNLSYSHILEESSDILRVSVVQSKLSIRLKNYT